MDKKESYIVGLGEVLLDCFPDGSRKLGGAPAIFAYHAHQSKYGGLCGRIVSAIGNDEDGRIIKDIITKDHHMETSNLPKVAGHSSGTVKVDNSDPNNPQYNIDTNAAWTAIPYDNKLKDTAKNTCAVYFGTLASYCGEVSKKTIDSFLEDVSDDCLKIYDINLRFNPDRNNDFSIPLFDEELIIDYVRKCNVLKVNLEELEYLCKIKGITGGERKKCREIMGEFLNVKLLIVTMGDEGSSIFWRENGEIAFSSLGMPTKVKNTVGAGDALAGALIGEFLRRDIPIHDDEEPHLIYQLLGKERVDPQEELSLGKVLASIHHTAVRRSAIVCEEGDSMPKITQADLFISYARNNTSIVKKVFCKKFDERRLTYWQDVDRIRCGQKFRPIIEQAIKNCEIVVYFSSKESNSSDYCRWEIETAYNNNKIIIPVKLDDTNYNFKDDHLRGYLENLDYLDFTASRLISSIIKERAQE